MIFKRTLLGLQIFLFSLVSYHSQAAEKGQPLLFPATQNNIQVLPQKFEYSLRDAYRFLLGNRIIDTSLFELTVRPLDSKVEVDIRWPNNLFSKGSLNILSPSGVSVWSTTLQDNQNFISIENGTDLVTKLLGLSFFKYCISQYELSTGMEICSPEMIAKGSGKKLVIQNNTLPNKPRIQINGRSVTPHGIVFLNDANESLSFRAIAASGAEFKMDTRSINLDFMDVISVNENLMSITIKGPYPLAPSQYRIIRDGVWSVSLKKDRALVYIAGEGKVPLRQEFVVQGALPTEDHRLYLEKSSPTLAYASSLELRGWSPEKGIPQASDPASDVSVTGNRFAWSLKNLSVGDEKVSSIQVVDGKDIFTAGYSFSRAYSNRIELLGGMNTFESTLYLGAEGQMWFESLPFLTYITQQRVGLGVIFNQDLTGDFKTMLIEFDLYWRLKKGLQLIDPSFVVGAGLQNMSFESASVQTLAPFVGWIGNGFKKFKYFTWQEVFLKTSMPAKAGSLEVKSRTELKWKLYHPLKDQSKLRYSVGLYSEESTEKRSGGLLEAAWVWVF